MLLVVLLRYQNLTMTKLALRVVQRPSDRRIPEEQPSGAEREKAVVNAAAVKGLLVLLARLIINGCANINRFVRTSFWTTTHSFGATIPCIHYSAGWCANRTRLTR